MARRLSSSSTIRKYRRLLQACDADAGRRHCVEASHGRGAAPGGGVAGMQYLPAPGDHCRSPDETGRQAARGTALATTVAEGENAFRHLQYHPCAFTKQEEAETGEPNVQFRDVSIAYRSVKGDDRLVFDGLNLEIRRGEKIALIGSNGAGNPP